MAKANMTENQLDAPMPAADVATIGTSATTIRTKLPKGGTFTLTEEQRESKLSMDVDNRVTVQKTIEEVTNFGAAVLPAYFTAVKLSNDKTLFEQLESVEGILVNLLNNVRDLKRQAAHEAMATALAAYQMFKAAALAGIPEAQGPYERLRERWEGTGGAPTTTVPDTE